MADKELFSKTGNSIYNDEIRLFLREDISGYFSQEKYSEMNNTKEYCETFRKWIHASELNKIHGLNSYPFCEVSLGVTQALDSFHYEILMNKKRLRLFRGEYPYNRDVHPFDFDKDYIEDRPLQRGDAVILSCPFSGSGSVHPQMESIIAECEKLEIPIFLDMAWFGTCAGVNIDLSSKAIKYVSFSLTKSLTCGNYRSGVRFRREAESSKIEDRLSLQHAWTHGIHLNTFIGTHLMRKFSPDFHYLKYRTLQMQICGQHGLVASQCVHIALGDDAWGGFSRDGVYNRVNLRDAIKKLEKQSQKI